MIADINGKAECVAGAAVELGRVDSVVGTTSTDAFGDFKFDGIPPGSGKHSLAVAHRKFGAASCRVDVGDESVYLGEIRLA